MGRHFTQESANDISEMYVKLMWYVGHLQNLLDEVVMTPYELGALLDATLMVKAYLVQCCMYYSEFEPWTSVPEEVTMLYRNINAVGVVVSHELAFTAKQDQAKQATVTGIVATKSAYSSLDVSAGPPDFMNQEIASATTTCLQVQEAIKVSDDPLHERYPLWDLYNFKIKYTSNKGTPILVKFEYPFTVRGEIAIISFDTDEWITVRTNDTQSTAFEAKTFIVK